MSTFSTFVSSAVEKVNACVKNDSVEAQLTAAGVLLDGIQAIQSQIQEFELQNDLLAIWIDSVLSLQTLSTLNQLLLSPNNQVSAQTISIIRHLVDLKNSNVNVELESKFNGLSIENLPNIICLIEHWIKSNSFFEESRFSCDMTQIIIRLLYDNLSDSYNYGCSYNNDHVTKIFSIVCSILRRYALRRMEKNAKAKINANKYKFNNTHMRLEKMSTYTWFRIAHAWDEQSVTDLSIAPEYVFFTYISWLIIVLQIFIYFLCLFVVAYYNYKL